MPALVSYIVEYMYKSDIIHNLYSIWMFFLVKYNIKYNNHSETVWLQMYLGKLHHWAWRDECPVHSTAMATNWVWRALIYITIWHIHISEIINKLLFAYSYSLWLHMQTGSFLWPTPPGTEGPMKDEGEEKMVILTGGAL